MRFRFLLGLILGFLSVRTVAAPPEPFPGLGRKWTHYQSPNFELYSGRSEDDSRTLLEQMELLRALFLDTFKMPVRIPQPVTIFAFGSDKDFKAYIPPDKRGSASYDGFCLTHPDRTVITMAPGWSQDSTSQIVYHEYIHCIQHMAEEHPPPWYNEGVAELFSTIKVDKKWVTFGTPLPGRILTLRQRKLMPIERLFAVPYDSPSWREEEFISLFYAESWALLHYLYFGENRIPPGKVSLFLRLAGAPEVQERPDLLRANARELLGMDYPELEKALDRYTHTGTYIGRKVERPALPAKETYAMRLATADEMTLRLAELAVRFTDSAYAKLAILNRLERAPEARLNELLGTEALHAGEADVARDRWLQAVEQGSTNVAVFRELGRLESNLVFGYFDLDYRMPAERCTRLRTLLDKSLAAAPEQSAGYEMLAWVEATAPQPDVAAVIRVQQRFNTLKNKPRTLLALTLVRIRLGKTEEALQMLDDLAKIGPDDWVKYCSELTRARLEKRPVDQAKLPKSPGVRAGGIVMRPPTLELTPPH